LSCVVPSVGIVTLAGKLVHRPVGSGEVGAGERQVEGGPRCMPRGTGVLSSGACGLGTRRLRLFLRPAAWRLTRRTNATNNPNANTDTLVRIMAWLTGWLYEGKTKPGVAVKGIIIGARDRGID